MLRPLPFDAGCDKYDAQAAGLLEDLRLGYSTAVEVFHQNHPRFLDEKVPWLPKRIEKEEIRTSVLTLEDARLALARWYSFRDWAALEEYVRSVAEPQGETWRYEAAVEAVVNGWVKELQVLLRRDPELVGPRSARVTKFDPPVHGAMLLHYVAANGVEGHRQKTPATAVEIARTLLEAGAEPDALAFLYGGQCTTMSLLVSSCHPAQAGLQGALVEVLVEFGASVERLGSGNWTSPLITALVFGYGKTAELLVRLGAQVSSLEAAAGLGRTEQVSSMLEAADAASRHRALALAAQLGRAEVVRVLLAAGEDPNRYNPESFHAHSTPLHQAALAGYLETVKVLVESGARLDMPDKIYQSTPMGWAEHAGQSEVREYLVAKSPDGAV